MPALGLVLAWGGYWFLAYGLLYRKGLPLTLTDVALPSRRSKVTDMLRTGWAVGVAGTAGQGAAAGGEAAIAQLNAGRPAQFVQEPAITKNFELNG